MLLLLVLLTVLLLLAGAYVVDRIDGRNGHRPRRAADIGAGIKQAQRATRQRRILMTAHRGRSEAERREREFWKSLD